MLLFWWKSLGFSYFKCVRNRQTGRHSLLSMYGAVFTLLLTRRNHWLVTCTTYKSVSSKILKQTYAPQDSLQRFTFIVEFICAAEFVCRCLHQWNQSNQHQRFHCGLENGWDWMFLQQNFDMSKNVTRPDTRPIPVANRWADRGGERNCGPPL